MILLLTLFSSSLALATESGWPTYVLSSKDIWVSFLSPWKVFVETDLKSRVLLGQETVRGYKEDHWSQPSGGGVKPETSTEDFAILSWSTKKASGFSYGTDFIKDEQRVFKILVEVPSSLSPAFTDKFALLDYSDLFDLPEFQVTWGVVDSGSDFSDLAIQLNCSKKKCEWSFGKEGYLVIFLHESDYLKMEFRLNESSLGGIIGRKVKYDEEITNLFFYSLSGEALTTPRTVSRAFGDFRGLAEDYSNVLLSVFKSSLGFSPPLSGSFTIQAD
jgi:hypothetical protein